MYEQKSVVSGFWRLTAELLAAALRYRSKIIKKSR
jgi:hypothetical protein